MTTVCICGGGSLGHVIAGFLGAKEDVRVNVLTRKPELWNKKIDVTLPDGNTISGRLNIISNNPAEIIPVSDIIIFCLPGYAIKPELNTVRPFLSSKNYVGTIFSSTGFFFEAMKLLGSDIPLWGFQRVPFISRVREYGRSASLLGYKDSYNIAVENTDDKEHFRQKIETLFERPTYLLNNYYEASFTNSNPILHTGRLFSMFHDWAPGKIYSRNPMFYEEWTIESSELLIKMDEELFKILSELPVSKGFLKPILEYYDSYDALSLTKKLSSIKGFKGITSPMVKVSDGYMLDFSSRYFKEDFPYGLHYIYTKGKELGIETPFIDKVYEWGMGCIDRC